MNYNSVVALRSTLVDADVVDRVVPGNTTFSPTSDEVVAVVQLLSSDAEARTLGGAAGMDTHSPVVQLTLFVPYAVQGDADKAQLVDAVLALYQPHRFHSFNGVTTRVIRTVVGPEYRADTHAVIVVTLYAETVVNRS